jgi:hypothetical protein
MNNGFVVERPLSSPIAPIFCPAPSVRAFWPLLDGTLFVTTGGGGYRLPLGYQVLIAAPTATTMTMAAAGSAAGVTIDTVGTVLGGVGNFYAVSDISSSPVDIGVAAVPTSPDTTFSIAESTGAYTFRVCVENMAGLGPCADTNQATVP